MLTDTGLLHPPGCPSYGRDVVLLRGTVDGTAADESQRPALELFGDAGGAPALLP
ncbi:hypothetical protein GCM10010299_55030 [Streptomyces tanashiensis]|nr:hypothetical protein GCM10010299_55030 [Streptomyces tanashiensis]